MMRIPKLIQKKNKTIIEFDSIPFCNGIVEKPFTSIESYYSVASNPMGPIAQISNNEILDGTISSYNQDTYSFITPPPGINDWSTSLGYTMLEFIESSIFDFKPKSILEIGSGNLWVADKVSKLLKPEEFISIDPALKGSSNFIKIINDYFPSKKLKTKKFDLIIGLNVLEHVPNVYKFMRGLVKHLNMNGKIILCFPDSSRQLIEGDINWIEHEHLSYFTKNSLFYICRKSGLKITKLELENDEFFTVLTHSDDHNLKIEPLLDEHQLLYDAGRKLINLIEEEGSRIISYLKKNKIVAFHGATNGLNLFIHLTGIGRNKNIRIYDGDASKTGKFLSSSISQIMHPSNKNYLDNDLLYISALSFEKEIRFFAINEKNYKGEIVLPLLPSS